METTMYVIARYHDGHAVSLVWTTRLLAMPRADMPTWEAVDGASVVATAAGRAR